MSGSTSNRQGYPRPSALYRNASNRITDLDGDHLPKSLRSAVDALKYRVELQRELRLKKIRGSK